MIVTNPRERTRFFRFLAVGTLGAVVDFGVFNLLTKTTPIPAVIASGISFICAVFSNFIWNRYWTYSDSRSKPITGQLLQFTLVNSVGLGIRIPLFAFLEPRMINLYGALNLPIPLSFQFLGYNTSLAIAVLVVLLWNFFANRFWTYSDVSTTQTNQ